MKIVDKNGNVVIEYEDKDDLILKLKLNTTPGLVLDGVMLSEADLRGVDLREADLTDARLAEAKLERTNLNGANLTGANLTRTNLAGAKLERTNLNGANLTGANLTRTNLTGADLTGADLTRTNLTGADLAGADLTRTNLTGADLAGANLTKADLIEANLEEADLTDTNLASAILRGTNLMRADLTRANLDGANLRRTNLKGANLIGANLFGTDFTKADLEGVTGLPEDNSKKTDKIKRKKLKEGIKQDLKGILADSSTKRADYEEVADEFYKKTGKKITKESFEILKELMGKPEITIKIIADEEEYRTFQIFYEGNKLVGLDYRLETIREGEAPLFEEILTEEKKKLATFFNNLFYEADQKSLNRFVEIEMAAYEYYKQLFRSKKQKPRE